MQKQFEIIVPESAEEFRQLWQLNYQIFAAELKMRPETSENFLVDKFHHKNIYRAARHRETGSLAGMIAAHWIAPYSAAEHFGEKIACAPDEGKLAEIRLFALLPEYRSTTLAAQLAVPLLLELEKQGVSEVIISGISTRKRFYEHIGFQTMGEGVVSGDTLLYPMRGKLQTVLMCCQQPLIRYR